MQTVHDVAQLHVAREALARESLTNNALPFFPAMNWVKPHALKVPSYTEHASSLYASGITRRG
jgi:hypothetical protein